MNPHLTSREPPPLLHRVAAGDPTAVRECVQRYGGLVWSLARRMSGGGTDAEDAVQEIFVDLWKSAGRYDTHTASEPTFIAMIARRRLIDRRRRRVRRKDVDSLDGPPPSQVGEPQLAGDLPSQAEVSAEAGLAARALAQLRPEQRRVVVLASYYGLSHEEIAGVTGMPLGTVKAHARRGLLRVREALSPVTGGGR